MELRFYQTAAGKRPFADWMDDLKDRQARARIQARLARAMTGNLGDFASVGAGVMEMRIDWGPGYRVYFSTVGQLIVLLLCGGDKSSQRRDIERAKTYLEDFKARSAKKTRGA